MHALPFVPLAKDVQALIACPPWSYPFSVNKFQATGFEFGHRIHRIRWLWLVISLVPALLFAELGTTLKTEDCGVRHYKMDMWEFISL